MDTSKLREFVGVLMCAALAGVSAQAAGSVNSDYIRSLAAPGKTVLVIEYYGSDKTVASRKGFVSSEGFKPISPTDFRVDEKVSLHLYGLEPCRGEMVNQRDGFAGSCDDYAKEQLSVKLRAAKVIFCRAFLTASVRRSRLRSAVACGSVASSSL